MQCSINGLLKTVYIYYCKQSRCINENFETFSWKIANSGQHRYEYMVAGTCLFLRVPFIGKY